MCRYYVIETHQELYPALYVHAEGCRRSMEPSSLPASEPTASEPALGAILARAETTVARAADRLLVARLHQALDRDGSAALTALSETLLPLLQALIVVLPRAVAEGSSPAVLAAARTLGMVMRERGVELPDLATEGLQLHDRLLREVAADLRESDRTLVLAVLQISRTILEMERAALLAYQKGADAALIQSALSDPDTGLASRAYFVERLTGELQRARRRERPLALVLITIEGAERGAATRDGAMADDRDGLTRLFSALLRRQLRGIDLATYQGNDRFALLLLDSDHDGAMAFLGRLTQDVATREAAIRVRAGVAVPPDEGLTADALLEQAEQALIRARRQPA